MNPIGWCHKTVNFGGGCDFRCSYCFARIQLKRQKWNCRKCYKFKPHLHLERLNQITPRQKPARIFIDSTWDFNTHGLPVKGLQKIINRLAECPQHTFQILSKYPVGYARFKFPKNVWLGTTITRTGDVHRLRELRGAASGNLCFVSIEPIQEQINYWFNHGEVEWLICGLETGHRKNKVIPKREWIDRLIINARTEHIPIFIKTNIVKLFDEDYKIEEFPNA